MSFLTLTYAVNVTNLFSSSPTVGQYNLERLSSASLFQANLKYASKAKHIHIVNGTQDVIACYGLAPKF
jgi:hypothetical protein